MTEDVTSMGPNQTATAECGNKLRRGTVYLDAEVWHAVDAECNRRAAEGATSRGPGATASRSAVLSDAVLGRLAVQESPPPPVLPLDTVLHYRRPPLLPSWVQQGPLTAPTAIARAEQYRARGFTVRLETVAEAAAVEDDGDEWGLCPECGCSFDHDEGCPREGGEE